VQVHGFEHGKGMFGDLLIVRISSHGSDSLRPVENVVTGRYSNGGGEELCVGSWLSFLR
jgi:hypothetical protein